MSALPSVNEYLSAALDYAARGWRVIPLHDVAKGACSCNRGAGCSSGGKHPRVSKWPTEATTDPAVIQRWWKTWPSANVGLAMGGESRLVALDIDPRHGGNDSLDSLADLPPTLTARTGSGGEHRIFVVPQDLDMDGLSNSASVIGPGLDLRTTGGQIVASPSRSATGSYSWVDIAAPIADLPHWLYKLALAEPEPDPAPRPAVNISTSSTVDRARKYIARIDGAVDGQGGHPRTFKVAIALVRGFNLSNETALMLLREFNERCRPKWKESDLRHKINDASTKSRAQWGYLLTDRRKPTAVVEDTSAAYMASQRAPEPEQEPESAPDGRPEIFVTLDLPGMVEQACRAIAALEVYQRARRLVSVARGQYGLETHAIGRGYLVELLTVAAKWIKIAPLKDADINLRQSAKVIVDGVECKRVEVQPPPSVVLAMCDRTTWPHVREIEALAEVPYTRADGEPCFVAGYDAPTKCLLMEAS